MVELKILIDYRERIQSQLLEDLFDEIVLTKLPIGDYVIISKLGTVIIERKTVSDFFASVRTNRLWDQLLRMMKTEEVFGNQVKRKILLVQGNFEEYFESIVWKSKQDRFKHWSQLIGAYLEIVYVYNIPIIHAETEIAFKAFMKILSKRESTGANEKLPNAKWYTKPVKADLPIKDRKRYILSALPYIGDRLAENLLQYFKTISRVACATKEELQKVPKIGKRKADLIYKLFH
jgi:ERCC4-type nuclease